MQERPYVGRVVSLCVLTAALALGIPYLNAQEAKPLLTVSEGKLVALEYTLKLEDDTSVLESNVGGNPLTYTHGSQQIIPGLEKALAGLKVGDTKEVVVPPADGYGDVNPQARQEIKKDLVPPDALKVGTRLQGTLPDGRPVFPVVMEVKDETVLLDFNHPLAGKTLHFDVKVVDIQPEQSKPAPMDKAPEPKDAPK